MGLINFCGPTTSSTKNNPYLLFVILVHSQKTVQLFVYQNTQSYLLLPFSTSTSSSLHRPLLFFIFCFVATNNCKTHKPTPNLHKLTSTLRSTKTTTRSIFRKSYKPFFCVQESVFLQKNLAKILFQYVFNFSYVHVLKNIESNQILFIVEIVTLFIVLGTVDMLFIILVSTRGSNLLLS